MLDPPHQVRARVVCTRIRYRRLAVQGRRSLSRASESLWQFAAKVKQIRMLDPEVVCEPPPMWPSVRQMPFRLYPATIQIT
jgi:hypothetical protein